MFSSALVLRDIAIKLKIYFHFLTIDFNLHPITFKLEEINTKNFLNWVNFIGYMEKYRRISPLRYHAVDKL